VKLHFTKQNDEKHMST